MAVATPTPAPQEGEPPAGERDADEAAADTGPAPPPTNRMAVALLSLGGFFVALYLLAYNTGLTGLVVCGVGSCETVQASQYAKIGPVPVSAIGAAGYAVLFTLALVGIQPGRRESPVIGGLLLAGAAAGTAYSGYLTYLEAAVIHAWCQWCVISAVLVTLTFLAALPELRRLRAT